jgi:hypothetical protein
MASKRVMMSDLPASVRDAIKTAFQETGCMDLYNGDAVQYITVIGERIRDVTAECDRLTKLARQMVKRGR